MTTPDQIRFAYSSTLQAQHGYSIEDYFTNVRGSKTNTIYEILRYLRIEKSPFGTKLVRIENTCKLFFVTYKVGEFEVLVKHSSWGDEFPFNTVETFADWLNTQEKNILDAARELADWGQ